MTVVVARVGFIGSNSVDALVTLGDEAVDLSAALGFAPSVSLSEGLGEYVEWARTETAA